jgi:copper chaperone
MSSSPQIFKTSISCPNCVNKVTATLNGIEPISHWEVDTLHPDHLLRVTASHPIAETLIEKLALIGFQAEPVQDPAD